MVFDGMLREYSDHINDKPAAFLGDSVAPTKINV